jgi:hypothetical protein
MAVGYHAYPSSHWVIAHTYPLLVNFLIMMMQGGRLWMFLRAVRREAERSRMARHVPAIPAPQ